MARAASKPNPVNLSAEVKLSGGARDKNIFWQVGGGAGVEIGTTAHIEGTILAKTAIHLRTGASLNGKAFAQTAVTMDKNKVADPTGDYPHLFAPHSQVEQAHIWVQKFGKNRQSERFSDMCTIKGGCIFDVKVGSILLLKNTPPDFDG